MHKYKEAIINALNSLNIAAKEDEPSFRLVISGPAISGEDRYEFKAEIIASKKGCPDMVILSRVLDVPSSGFLSVEKRLSALILKDLIMMGTMYCLASLKDVAVHKLETEGLNYLGYYENI